MMQQLRRSCAAEIVTPQEAAALGLAGRPIRNLILVVLDILQWATHAKVPCVQHATLEEIHHLVLKRVPQEHRQTPSQASARSCLDPVLVQVVRAVMSMAGGSGLQRICVANRRMEG